MKKSRPKRLWFALGGFLAVAAIAGSPQQAFAEPQSTGVNQEATVTVKGTVFDENDEPVIGASVVVKGSKASAVTDIDGNFSIRCKKSDRLVISYVGYNPLEISASANLSDIKLQAKSELLDDVVVIGYGTTTRRAAVGAVDQVKGEKIAERPVLNMTQAMQGAAPNVIIQSNSYDPNNQSTTFNVRGVTSTTSSSPLFVIDGVVADDGAFNRLNPNDVENISVLKDAGAAAIYGSRSAAGVILVTTKGGKKDPPATVTFSANVGWQDPYYPFDTVDGYQNATLYNQALINSGLAPKFTPEEIQDLYNHRAEEVWAVDEISKTALQQKYNVMVQGGSKNTTYMFSLGYYNQASNLVGKNNQGIQRYNMRMNIGTDIGRFHIGAIMQYTRNNSMMSSAYLFNVYADSRRTPKYYYNNTTMKDGLYVYNTYGGSPVGALNTPGYNKYRNNDFSGTINADFKIIEGLKLRGVFGANVNNQARSTRNIPVEHYSPSGELQTVSPKDYSAGNWNYDSYRLNSQLLLDFNRTFKDIHTVNAMFGFTNESWTGSGNEVSQGYIDPDLGTPSEDTTTENDAFGGHTYLNDRGRTSINSLIGRVGYNYADKYLAEFTFRYDGSSKFHKDHRWGFFPSGSAGWRFSEEEFFAPLRNLFNNAKLRLSYGELGNQNVSSYYTFLRMVTTNKFDSFTFDGANKAVYSSLGAPIASDMTWETSKQWDLGLDFSMLNNRLSFTGDLYIRDTHDMLTDGIALPSVYGADPPQMNTADLRTKAYEAAITWNDNFQLFGHPFTYSVGFNISDYRSHITRYDNPDKSFAKDYYVGQRIGEIWGYRVDGYFKSTEEAQEYAKHVDLGSVTKRVTGGWQAGDIKFLDLDGDRKIGVGSNTADNPGDRTIIGNSLASLQYGINASIRYFGFDVSAFFQGTGNHYWYPTGQCMPFWGAYSYSYVSFLRSDFRDLIWSEDNPDAYFPRPMAYAATSGTLSFVNDRYLQNLRYLRFKNLTVGYSLPQKWIRKAYLEKVRVYFTGEHLCYWSPLKKNTKWLDPESAYSRSEQNNNLAYTFPKTYMVGIDITF